MARSCSIENVGFRSDSYGTTVPFTMSITGGLASVSKIDTLNSLRFGTVYSEGDVRWTWELVAAEYPNNCAPTELLNALARRLTILQRSQYKSDYTSDILREVRREIARRFVTHVVLSLLQFRRYVLAYFGWNIRYVK